MEEALGALIALFAVMVTGRVIGVFWGMCLAFAAALAASIGWHQDTVVAARSSMRRQTTWVALAVIAVATAADGEIAFGTTTRSGNHPLAFPLVVVQAPLPPLRLPNYRTSGRYLQVSSSRADVTRVNASLRRAVLEAERRWSRRILEAERIMPQIFRRSYPYSGRYTMSVDLNLVSASTVVASVLMPVFAVLPGGNNGSTWLAITVRVPSGEPLTLSDLFVEPKRGLDALAGTVRRKLVATNSCIRQSLRDPVGGEFNARGFAPTRDNYRYFALTTSGLAIGFPIGQVGGSSCSRVKTIVRYSVLRPYLSHLGKTLIAGVRRPKP